ncbi:MAG: asparagine synthase C-terminal domain-containing protein [Thermoleophilia bacterium]
MLAPFADVDPGRRMLLGDLLTYLPENMLLRGDKVLMAASLEGRAPLLDYRVVERASRTPVGQRAGLRVGKAILREAVADLIPPEVLAQPKRGFPVPVARILLDDPSQVLRRLVLSDRCLSRGLLDPDALRALVVDGGPATGERGLKRFTVAALELWARVNVDAVRTGPPGSLEELLDPAETG